MVHASSRSTHSLNRKERIEDDLLISELFVLAIALYAVILTSLWRWDRHAAIFALRTAAQ